MTAIHTATDRWRGMSRAAKAAVIIGALFVIGVAGAAVTPASTTSSPGSGKYEAFHACETFVKHRLKAPTTARFRNPVEDDGDVGWVLNDATWTITSTVDSENSFGASLRSTFTCTITDAGDHWHLDHLTLD